MEISGASPACTSCSVKFSLFTAKHPCAKCSENHSAKLFCKKCLEGEGEAQGYCLECIRYMHCDAEKWFLSSLSHPGKRRSSSTEAQTDTAGIAIPFRPGADVPKEWRRYLEQEDVLGEDSTSYPKVFLQVVNESSDLAEETSIPIDYSELRIRKTDPECIYELQQSLAHGESGGVVYSAKTLSTGEVVAIKVVKLASKREKTLALREVKMIYEAQAHNAVRYIETFDHHKYPSHRHLWIVCELMKCSLRQLLSSVVLPETAIAYVCREVVVALQSLHAARIIHRDVCSANILIGKDVTPTQGSVKLCDFGYSLLFPPGRERSSTVVGSPYYMSPEVSTGSKYDYKADVWSLGITALEMAEGIPPLANQNPVRALFLAASITPPALQSPISWTPAFTDFVSLCVQKSPGKRASSEELIRHRLVVDMAESGKEELMRALERVRN